MIKGDYEIYHYREPYFKSLDFHTHDFYELYLFLDGSVTYYVEDMAYDLMAGDIMLIPPQKMHRPVISNENNVYERIVLWVSQSFLQELDGNGELRNSLTKSIAQNGFLLSLDGDSLILIKKLLSLLNQNGASRQEYNKSIITAVFYFLNDEYQSGSVSDKSDELIPSVIRYINEHFTEPFSLSVLCDEFFITKFYLLKRFKAYTNSTIYDYVLDKRISLARRLIRQGEAATVVSEKCGFSDYSSFYKAFTAKSGMSPAKFKKTVKAENN